MNCPLQTTEKATAQDFHSLDGSATRRSALMNHLASMQINGGWVDAMASK